MKKILLFLMTFWCAIVSMAQTFDVEKNAALQIVSANRTAIGLTADDLNNLMVTYSYVDKTIGVRYIYVQQTYQGIPVYNKTQAIAYKNNALVSVLGTRIANIESKVNSSMPAKTAESAVMAALANKGFSPSGSLAPISTKEMGRKVEFGKLGVSRENVTAQLMWFPSDNENSFKLGWFVYYIPTTTSDYWEIFVDAANGSIIGENNLTVSCNWDDPNHTHVFGEKHNEATIGSNPFDFSRVTRIENGTVSPSIVNTGSYRVVPLPYESPIHMPGAFPGTAPGNSTIVNNPWTNVPASFSNAVTKNWHTDASNTDYNYTRGNNVWAYHDRNNNNSGDPARSATSTTALPSLTFSAYGNAPDYTADPITGGGTTGGMANNQLFNITNLFYYNNILHDVLYTHGFDEVARNFQSDNFGRGGNGNDFVLGEAQDGSGTNNANFATPADGSSGRMQMYIWTQTSPSRDGDVDNGIIAHELGHGVSNRLMGSSTNQTGCVANGEHAGEGISDYIALMTTQDWAAANINTGLVGRGIGTFALGQPVTGVGIRSQRYSTDLSINSKKYLAVLPGAVHDRGEHWCAAAWEATWAIIQQSGTISPNIYYNSAGGGNGGAGNIAAMRIAIQAMKLVPCGTGFVDHRNAWLAADTILYGGQFSCAIWRAFAKRGLGFFADQGSAASSSDQTPDETPKSQSNITTGVTTIPAGQNMTYTVTASTCSGTAITGYEMRTTLPANVTFVSATNGGVLTGNIVKWPVSMAANGTFSAQVTITVNANAFPGNVVTQNCLFESNLAAARSFGCKTVTTPITPILAGCPTITTQPASVTTCAGSSVNFGVVANATNPITYQWQLLVGATWTNLTNVAPYSNVGTATMTINPTAVGLNGNQYRCFMTTIDCTGGVSSNPATLTVVAASVGGTLSPAATTVCGATSSTTMTLSGHVGNVVTWEVSTNGGTTWTPIAGTAGATTYTAVNVTVTSQYRAVIQVSGGCAAVNSAIAVITAQAAQNLIIVADPNTPICAGDPTRLTAADGFGVVTLSNNGSINIPDGPSNPYGPSITASNFPTSGVTVTGVQLRGLNHTWAGDLDIALTSPTGTAVMLLSDIGGSADFINNTMNFADANPLFTTPPAANGIGNVRPTNTAGPDAFPAPGPASVPANGLLSQFTGDFNGAWRLWINDQATLDVGSLTGGFSITFTGPPSTPVTTGTFLWTPATGLNSTTTNPVAASPAVTTTYTVSHNNGAGCVRQASYTVVVNQRPLVTVQPVSVASCSGSAATFSITATGAGPLTYQWQVGPSATGPWTNVSGVPYTGENTPTLTINPTSVLLNNNWYRCVVGGLCPPIAGSTSQAAKLTVNPLPNVTINPVGPVCGGVAGISGTKLEFALTAPPVPGSVTVTNNTAFPITDNTPAGTSSNITVSGVPANATITGIRATLNGTHTWLGDVVMVLKAPGTLGTLNLDYYLNRTGAGPTTNFVNTTFSSASTTPIGTASPFTGVFKADEISVPTAPINAPAGPTGMLPTVPSYAALIGAINAGGAGAANGTYTLGVADNFGGDAGTVSSWSITIDYTTPGTIPGTQNWVYSWSPIAGLFIDPTATTAYTGDNRQTVYAAPTALTTYTLTVRDTVTGCIGTNSVIVNYTPPAPNVTPNPVSMCLGAPAVMLRSSSSTTTLRTFTSGTINVAIPEGAFPGRPATAATNVIAVSGIPANANITNVVARLNATHAYANDIVAVLRSPSGAIINIDAVGGYANAAGANYLNTGFSTNTSLPSISTGTAPFSSTYKADLAGPTFTFAGFTLFGGPVGFDPTTTSAPGFLAGLGAGAANGNWTLAAYDAGAPDVGSLTKWDLEITYVVGVPATPAVWSPATHLYSDANATIPYIAGTAVDSVWVKPTPFGVYNYDVTVQSTPPPPAVPATPMAGGNGNNTVAFNVTNNNAYAVTLRGISSNAFGGGAITANAYWKNAPIAGNPGLINVGNGWNLVTGSGVASTVAANTLNPVLTNLSGVTIPANGTIGVVLEFIGATFPAYTNGAATTVSYTNNGCTITTGGNVGWGGPVAPGPMVNNPRNFNGTVTLVPANFPACTSPARRVVVTVRDTVKIITNPVSTSSCITTGTNTSATFRVVATGDALTYQWQTAIPSVIGGLDSFVNLANGVNYAGVTTATLTINNPPVSWNGKKYRVVVSGSCGSKIAPNPNVFAPAILTVPSVTLTLAGPAKLFPGLTTSLVASPNPTPLPSPLNYEWYRNGTLVTTTTINSLVVNVDGLGDYTVRTVSGAGCANVSNVVTISDSVSGKVFVYPNPNNGIFQVRYYSSIDKRSPRGINIYDDKGARIAINQFSNTAPYTRMDIDLRKHGKGIYWIEIVDRNGERLAVGRAVVL
jgi:subtilisin-like proprotein convertase family protein